MIIYHLKIIAMKIKPNIKEIDVDVDYEHDPYEPQTFDSPGYPEEIRIMSVNHNGIEILDYLSDIMLEQIEANIKNGGH